MPGFLWPPAVYLVVLVLHIALPAREVAGYVTDPATGEPLRYRLNGPLVLAATVLVWVGASRAGLFPCDAFYTQRWAMAAGACASGLVFSLAMVFTAPREPEGRGPLADFYLGRRQNPQWCACACACACARAPFGRRVDAKMYLYLVGATLLELNVVSYVAHHLARYPDPSPGLLLSAALLTFFVVEYLVFERVHLYTYDLFAERVGFKLGWGCLAFYPFFYGFGLAWAASEPDPHVGATRLWLAGGVFFAGWGLSRGANLQKYLFKTNPEKKLLGLLAPGTVSDGQRRLLCSGFWGVSRHVNYLGEILMALGVTLALGYPRAITPWLYPLYYVALLVPRERDDDRRCRAKYGALWEEYCRRVPYRIVPWLY